jgi:hypothetical protein
MPSVPLTRAINTVCVCLAIAAAGCATEKPTPSPSTPQPAPVATNQLATPRTVRPATPPAGTQQLFDGRTLSGWRISDFAGSGPVKVDDGKLILEMGTMTGVTYTNTVPNMNYEISLDAMRVDGSDFFCGLTFPVGNDPCSLIVGGWGGGVVGLSSLDNQDAANNETTQYLNFEKGRWYNIRLRVVPNQIQAWIDNDKIIDVDTTDRKISIRIEVEESRPLGIATWSTTGALRNIQLRKL